jgi:hypothetical protein
MFRKRYTVVIVGEAGSSAAQRSEVSRHRSERDAQIAAQYERERLGGMHGDRTGQYRVTVEREGVVISTGPIADLTGLPMSITHDAPAHGVDPQLDSATTDPGRMHPIIAAFPGRADVPGHAPADDSTTSDIRPPGTRVSDDDLPSGPVPEEVLRRFEDAIAREQRRQANPEEPAK